MHGNRPARVLFLLVVALLLAATASPAVSAYGVRVVISQTAPTLTRQLEDEVTPELSWAASLLGDGGIGYDAIKHPDKPVCDPHCPAKGEAYSRGCEKKYDCKS